MVYLAQKKDDNELVAIKRINIGESKEEDILREIEFMQNLSSPNIVKFDEFYQASTKIYLVTELCQGGELFDYIVSKGKLPEIEAKIAMYQLFQGVKYMHDRGIIHRDLKPENILLKRKKDITDIKITDFGLSTYYKRGAALKKRVGTPYYMSPQVLARHYGSECDLWSLGVIMYILVTGYPPFNAPDDNGIMNLIKKGYYNLDPDDFKGKDEAENLIIGLLEYNPETRLDANQSLASRWFNDFNLERDSLLLKGEKLEGEKVD